jgi:hypothetical protein
MNDAVLSHHPDGARLLPPGVAEGVRVTLRQKLIESGLFKETDDRDLVHEEVREAPEPYSGHPVKVGMLVRLKFDPFGDLVSVRASQFDPVMREMVEANRKARRG